MIDYSYNLVIFVANNTDIFPAAIVVASLNLLIQTLFSLIFGSKGLPKIRGYRGE